MKFENITLNDLNFIVGAVDSMFYDIVDTTYQYHIDTIAAIIDAVATNSQEQDSFRYKCFQDCITRWRKEIDALE